MITLPFEPLPARMPLSYPAGTVFRTRDKYAHSCDTYFMAVGAVTLHHECCYMGAFVSWTDAGRAHGRLPHPLSDSSIGRDMITGVYVEEYMRPFVKEAP